MNGSILTATIFNFLEFGKGHSPLARLAMNRVARENSNAITSMGNDMSPMDTLRRRKTPTTTQVNRPVWKLRNLYLSLSSKRRAKGIFSVFIFLLVFYTLLVLKNGSLKLAFNSNDSSETEPWSLESAKAWFGETASLQNKQHPPSEMQSKWSMEQKEYEAPKDVDEIQEQQLPFIQVWKHGHSDITVCRIFGVCIGSKGLRVFQNTSKAKKQLEYCGIKPHLYESSGVEEWLKISAMSNYSIQLDKDLVSYLPLRTHMPHFIEDVTPFIAIRDIIEGRKTALHGIPFQRKCSFEGNFPPEGCEKVDHIFNPFFLFDKSGFHRFNGSWTQDFLALLLRKVDLSAFVGSVHSNSTNVCFRSVVTGKGADLKYLLNHENSLYTNNKIRKRALSLSHWCEDPIQVTILSRKPNNARSLLQAESFAENIRKLQFTKESKKERKVCFIRFRCQIVYFEEMTFLEQMSVMQKTDILIAVHGAGNTNIVFLPENSVFIEIYPFAYKANIFEELARKYLLKYAFLIAEPDSKSFLQCLQKIERSHPELETNVNKLRSQWDAAVSKFVQGDHSHQLKMENPKVSDFVPSSRVCARNQTLKISWKDLCNLIEKQVSQML